MKSHKTAQPQTVGIRELKQNPSEIIARALSGVRFEVLSNGKPVGVVIQRDATIRSRWVSTEVLVSASAAVRSGLLVPASIGDTTEWADELREEGRREQDHGTDPILDPWDRASQATAEAATVEAAKVEAANPEHPTGGVSR